MKREFEFCPVQSARSRSLDFEQAFNVYLIFQLYIQDMGGHIEGPRLEGREMNENKETKSQHILDEFLQNQRNFSKKAKAVYDFIKEYGSKMVESGLVSDIDLKKILASYKVLKGCSMVEGFYSLDEKGVVSYKIGDQFLKKEDLTLEQIEQFGNQIFNESPERKEKRLAALEAEEFLMSRLEIIRGALYGIDEAVLLDKKAYQQLLGDYAAVATNRMPARLITEKLFDVSGIQVFLDLSERDGEALKERNKRFSEKNEGNPFKFDKIKIAGLLKKEDGIKEAREAVWRDGVLSLGDKPFGVEPGFFCVISDNSLEERFEAFLKDKELLDEELKEKYTLFFKEKTPPTETDNCYPALFKRFCKLVLDEGEQGKWPLYLVKFDFTSVHVDPLSGKETVSADTYRTKETEGVRKHFASNVVGKDAVGKIYKAAKAQTIPEASVSAAKENLATDLAFNFLPPGTTQEQFLFQSTYNNGTKKLLLACKWRPGLSPLGGNLKGGTPGEYDGYLVDEKGNALTIKHASDFLTLILTLGDRDSVGSKCQNKACASPIENSTVNIFGIDYGKAFNQENPLLEKLKTDYSFKQNRFAKQKKYKNLSVFTDTSFVEDKIPSLFRLFYCFTTDQLKAEFGFSEEEIARLNGVMAQYLKEDDYIKDKKKGCLLKVFDTHAKKYKALAEKEEGASKAIYEDCHNGVLEAKELFISNTKKIFDKFKNRMQLDKEQLTILDKLEKFYSKEVSDYDASGKVKLNYPVVRKGRVAFELYEENGTFKLKLGGKIREFNGKEECNQFLYELSEKVDRKKLGAFKDQGYVKKGSKGADGANGAGKHGIKAEYKDGSIALIKQDTSKNGTMNKGKVIAEPIGYRVINNIVQKLFKDIDSKTQISRATHIKIDADCENKKGCKTTYVVAHYLPEHQEDFWKAAFRNHYKEIYASEFSADMVDAKVEAEMQKLAERPKTCNLGGVVNGLANISENQTIIQGYLNKKPHLKADFLRFSAVSLLFGNLGLHPGNWGITISYTKIKIVNQAPGENLEEGCLYLHKDGEDYTLYSTKIEGSKKLKPEECLSIDALVSEKDQEIDKAHPSFREIVYACNEERLSIFDYGAAFFNLEETDFDPIKGQNTGLDAAYKHHFLEFGKGVTNSKESAFAFIKLACLTENDISEIVRASISKESLEPYILAEDLPAFCKRMKMSPEKIEEIRTKDLDGAIQCIQDYVIEKTCLRSKKFQKIGFDLLKSMCPTQEAFYQAVQPLSESEKQALKQYQISESGLEEDLTRIYKHFEDQGRREVKNFEFLEKRNKGSISKFQVVGDDQTWRYKKDTDPDKQGADRLKKEAEIYSKIYSKESSQEIKDEKGNFLGTIIPYLGEPCSEESLKALPFSKKIQIYVEMVTAVKKIQDDHQIIHRNLKIDSFALDAEGRVKINDFENAVYLGDGINKRLSLSRSKTQVAPEYLSTNHEQIGFKADVYALGNIGKILFNESGMQEILVDSTAQKPEQRLSIDEFLKRLEFFNKYKKVSERAPLSYERLMKHYFNLMKEGERKKSSCAQDHAAVIMGILESFERKLENNSDEFIITSDELTTVERRSRQLGRTVTHKTNHYIGQLISDLHLSGDLEKRRPENEGGGAIDEKILPADDKNLFDQDKYGLKNKPAPVRFEFKRGEKCLFAKVDNRGKEDSGFYSYAIGLIHLIKEDIETTGKSEHFEKLTGLNLGGVKLHPYTLEQFKNFNFRQDNFADKQLLEHLISDMKAALYHYRIDDVEKKSVSVEGISHLDSVLIFNQFAEVVRFFYRGESFDKESNLIYFSPMAKEKAWDLSRQLRSSSTALSSQEVDEAIKEAFLEDLYGKDGLSQMIIPWKDTLPEGVEEKNKGALALYKMFRVYVEHCRNYSTDPRQTFKFDSTFNAKFEEAAKALGEGKSIENAFIEVYRETSEGEFSEEEGLREEALKNLDDQIRYLEGEITGKGLFMTHEQKEELRKQKTLNIKRNPNSTIKHALSVVKEKRNWQATTDDLTDLSTLFNTKLILQKNKGDKSELSATSPDDARKKITLRGEKRHLTTIIPVAFQVKDPASNKYADGCFNQGPLTKKEIKDVLLSYTQGVSAFFGRAYAEAAGKILSFCDESERTTDQIMEVFRRGISADGLCNDTNSSFVKRFNYLNARYLASKGELTYSDIEYAFSAYKEKPFVTHQHKADEIIAECKKQELSPGYILKELLDSLKQPNSFAPNGHFVKTCHQLDRLRKFYDEKQPAGNKDELRFDFK